MQGCPPQASERFQVELSIRFNVLTNLARAFDEDVLAKLESGEGHGFPAETEPSAFAAEFNAAQIRDRKLFHERVFGHYETIKPVREASLIDADLRHAFREGEPADQRGTADRLRAEIDQRIEPHFTAAG